MRRSPTEILIRDATSNEKIPPSGQQMRQLADISYNFQDYVEIMRVLWERIEDAGKNWRHIYKSLLVLDYLVKNGAERVIQECRARMVQLKTLGEFQHIDDEEKDVGVSIRARAKQLIELLHDDRRIESERKNASAVRDRFGQAISSDGGRVNHGVYSSSNSGGGGGGGRYGGYGPDSGSYGGSSRGSTSNDYPGNYRAGGGGGSSRRNDGGDYSGQSSGRSRGGDDYNGRSSGRPRAPSNGEETEEEVPAPRKQTAKKAAQAPAPQPVSTRPPPNLLDADDDFFNAPAQPVAKPNGGGGFFAPPSGDDDFFNPRNAAPPQAVHSPLAPVNSNVPVSNMDDFTEFTSGASKPNTAFTSAMSPQQPKQPASAPGTLTPTAFGQTSPPPNVDNKDPWSKTGLFQLDSLGKQATGPANTGVGVARTTVPTAPVGSTAPLGATGYGYGNAGAFAGGQGYGNTGAFGGAAPGAFGSTGGYGNAGAFGGANAGFGGPPNPYAGGVAQVGAFGGAPGGYGNAGAFSGQPNPYAGGQPFAGGNPGAFGAQPNPYSGGVANPGAFGARPTGGAAPGGSLLF